MSVNGKTLCKKLRELRPDLSSSVKPEVLDQICKEPSVQPFLSWFCENVSRANVLTDEELRIKKTLEKSGQWLSGEELDKALEESTHDCPELLRTVTYNDSDIENLLEEFEATKNVCKENESYIHMLRGSLKRLQDLQNRFEDDIEQQETLLEKERIKKDKVYSDCRDILRRFDASNREFFKDIECLLNIYADASENRGAPISWTQVQLELFIKQIDLYNDYLDVYIKRQFGTDIDIENLDLDYVSLINNSKEKQVDEKMQELMMCKTNLETSKVDEVMAKVHVESHMKMLEYVQDIFNYGNLKIPQQIQLKKEIVDLSRRRDLLEETVMLLKERQLSEVAEQFADLEITKLLKNDADARLGRRKLRLEKLKGLLSLAREHGHVHVDLLCILMEMQSRCIKEVVEFIADARNYLSTEYSLSSARCESMQQQQNEYSEILASPRSYNAFDQLFMSMMLGSEIPNEPLKAALRKYNEIIAENNEKKRQIFETYLQSRINELQILEDEVMVSYMTEITKGPTVSFKPTSYEIGTRHDETVISVQELQTNVTKIRNKLKERMRSNLDLEREKDILWQRFLVDHDTLRARYEEAKHIADRSHFGDIADT